MKDVVLELTGVIKDEFVGIKYNDHKEKYEVWDGMISRYTTLKGAEKKLRRLFDFTDKAKYNKISDGVYELIKKENSSTNNTEISEALAWEVIGIMGR